MTPFDPIIACYTAFCLALIPAWFAFAFWAGRKTR